MRGTLVKVEAEVEFRVFSSIHSTNVDMKSEAFLGGYLEKLSCKLHSIDAHLILSIFSFLFIKY